jgi:precorrin-6B methylase 2
MMGALQTLLLRDVLARTRAIWTECNELALNIETRARATDPTEGSKPGRPWYRAELSQSAKHDDGNCYQSPDYWYVYRVARLLNPGPEDVFYDLGSGKGRIVCVMARKRMRKCVGVELNERLCETARRNGGRVRGRHSPIEIICADVANADLSDGTIYFMYNPFGSDTMREVLKSIEISLWKNPRRVTIVYHNALLEALLDEQSWLEKSNCFSLANGARVSIWKNIPEVNAVSAVGICTREHLKRSWSATAKRSFDVCPWWGIVLVLGVTSNATHGFVQQR